MSACSACRLADQPSGPDTVRAILRRYPGTKVLVLSEATDPDTLSQLIRSGVAGLTHQDQSVEQIAAALDAIEAGRNVLDPGPLRSRPATGTGCASCRPGRRRSSPGSPAGRAPGRCRAR